MKQRKLAGLWVVPLSGALLGPALHARADEPAPANENGPAPAEAAPVADAAPVAEAATAPADAVAVPDTETLTPVEAAKESTEVAAVPEEDHRILLAQTDVAPPTIGTGGGPGTSAGANVPAGTAGAVPGAAPGTPGGAPGAGAPGGMPGMPPGAPPISVILGYADLMLAADRPYEAEKIYKQIQANMPKLDPNDPKVAEMMKNMPPEAIEGMKQVAMAVQKGLEDVEYAKKPTVTLLGHYYRDDRDVRLYTYGGGPTFRTKYGRITVTSGTGHYRNDNNVNNPNNPLSGSPDIPSAEDDDTLKKSTFNILLEPYYKKFEGSFFLSNVTYDRAPDRFLYDFKISYLPKPTRQSFYISHGRHDSYFQNVNNQFYAPETYFQLKKKILYDDYSFGLEYPLTKRIDGTFSYRYFDYTDGNNRNNYRTQVMYRIKPTGDKPFPVWRVGADLIFDDSRFFTLDYTASVNFNAYSIATDYLWVSRKVKYGFYASYPLGEQNFDAPYGVFGFGSYQVSKSTELYAKLSRLSGVGNSISFSDSVIGMNVRF